jgi:hypothetical protein
MICKFFIVSCSLIFLAAVFANTNLVNNATIAQGSSLLVEIVNDEQRSVESVTLYLVKDPLQNPQIISTIDLLQQQFLLEPGIYSVGAYAPSCGWDARIVELREGQTKDCSKSQTDDYEVDRYKWENIYKLN